tara:strand:- start:600 stop:971 length:372 start_codon:yes stop_codon:yes gene_type:complete
MWEYKVIAGQYAIEGSDVIVENPLGRGTMQRILDHYTSEGFELLDTHLDNLNHEIVLTLRKPKGGVVAVPTSHTARMPVAAPAAAAAAPASDDDDDLPPRRRKPAAGGGRRSKAELDRLYRDS